MLSQIGKMQVNNVLKRKRDIEDAYKRNEPLSKHRRLYINTSDDLNDLMWKWFCLSHLLNTPLSEPLTQEQALEYTKKLRKTEIKASNGWLEFLGNITTSDLQSLVERA